MDEIVNHAPHGQTWITIANMDYHIHLWLMKVNDGQKKDNHCIYGQSLSSKVNLVNHGQPNLTMINHSQLQLNDYYHGQP